MFVYVRVYAVPLEARKDIRSPGTLLHMVVSHAFSIGFVRIK